MTRSVLTLLPDLDGLRRLTRSLATLDAVMSPEWQWRYYSFDSRWGDGEMMASMRNGQGDHWFALLCDAGAAVVGLAHEAEVFQPEEPPPWVFRDLPPEFHKNLLQEPAFDTKNSTFCVWRLSTDPCWCSGTPRPGEVPGADGADELLSILAGDPHEYVDFAADYYEVRVAVEDVEAVYGHGPLTRELALRLNTDVDFAALQAELDGIGYPEET